MLLGNARALNVNLRKTEAIVISHEHANHTDGREAPRLRIDPVEHSGSRLLEVLDHGDAHARHVEALHEFL